MLSSNSSKQVCPASRIEEPIIRTATATRLTAKTNLGVQLFAVTSAGALGFATQACYTSSDRTDTPPHPFFNVERFVRDFINFLGLCAVFYGKTGYYGSNLLEVRLTILDEAQVWQQPYFFSPQLQTIQVSGAFSRIRMALHPLLSVRWQEYLETVVNDLARFSGAVLSPLFTSGTKSEVELAVHNLLRH